MKVLLKLGKVVWRGLMVFASAFLHFGYAPTVIIPDEYAPNGYRIQMRLSLHWSRLREAVSELRKGGSKCP